MSTLVRDESVTPISEGQLAQMRKMAAEKRVSLAVLQRGLNDSGPKGFSQFLNELGPGETYFQTSIQMTHSHPGHKGLHVLEDVWVAANRPMWANHLSISNCENGLYVSGSRVLLIRSKKQKAYKKVPVIEMLDQLRGTDLLGGNVPIRLEQTPVLIPDIWQKERPKISSVIFLGTRYFIDQKPGEFYIALCLETKKMFCWSGSHLPWGMAVAVLEDD